MVGLQMPIAQLPADQCLQEHHALSTYLVSGESFQFEGHEEMAWWTMHVKQMRMHVEQTISQGSKAPS